MTQARMFINELDALGTQLIERALDILDLQANMEQTFAMLGNPARRFRIRSIGLKQLDVRLTYRKHRQPGIVLREKFFVLEIQTKLGFKQLPTFFQGFDGDCDVLDPLDLHPVAPNLRFCDGSGEIVGWAKAPAQRFPSNEGPVHPLGVQVRGELNNPELNRGAPSCGQYEATTAPIE
jgi:hypothetical protein